MRIVENDTDLAREVKEKIRDNGGYCCCAIFKSDDTRCICKEFREQPTEGDCHCGRYRKVRDT